VPRDKLLPKIAKLNESGIFKETFLISALNGDRVEEVVVRKFLYMYFISAFLSSSSYLILGVFDFKSTTKRLAVR